MRLIDADEFKKQIVGMAIINNYKPDKANTLCELIDAQPTAYDIDKVVEELEKIETHCLEMNDCQGQSAISDAIEIVKQGVVTDDVCEWKLEDEEANLYLTGCQQRQLIFEGTPKENEYTYCPYCGKKIKVVDK